MTGRKIFTVAAMLAALTVPAAVSISAGAQGATCFGRTVTIQAVAGQVTEGTSGNDVIMGTSGDDDIRGRGGNDRICSKGGDDEVSGGGGKDKINLGSGNDVASGGKGADRIDGKGGSDTINGNGGPDIINGGKGPDVISGGGKGDVLNGGGGGDTIEGNGGPDIIDGGRGTDVCIGGRGDDQTSRCSAPSAISPGTHRVGTDIAPGRYIAQAQSGCFWERLSGFTGDLDDTIANDFQIFAGPAIVDIAPTDAGFAFDAECGTFRPYKAPSSPSSTIVPGAHVVGSDIRPGTYRAEAEFGCYWERRTGFGGSLADVIVNDFVSQAGVQFVTILSSDEGFFADADCGNWTRQ